MVQIILIVGTGIYYTSMVKIENPYTFKTEPYKSNADYWTPVSLYMTSPYLIVLVFFNTLYRFTNVGS